MNERPDKSFRRSAVTWVPSIHWDFFNRITDVTSPQRRRDGRVEGVGIRLNGLLAAIAGAFVVVDAIWVIAGGFRVDFAPYLALAAVALVCIGGAAFYARIRNEAAFSAMFAATGFLMVFPAACCLLTYLAVTIAGPRIDLHLAAIDRSVGISWPAIMAFAANHSLLTQTLGLAYQSIVAQTLLIVLLLGWRQKTADLYGFCVAIGSGAIVTVTIWTAFPSFGAYSVYHLPSAVAHNLNLVESTDYGAQLTALLKNGPGFISPTDLRGLIGFPSYHTVQAIILAWYARNLAYLRWPSLILNGLMIAATPIEGGHHLVDILGGVTVAAFAIFAADAIVRKMQRNSSSPVARASGRSQPASA
jgi:membrane-associated phospholipid phosphatase